MGLSHQKYLYRGYLLSQWSHFSMFYDPLTALLSTQSTPRTAVQLTIEFQVIFQSNFILSFGEKKNPTDNIYILAWKHNVDHYWMSAVAKIMPIKSYMYQFWLGPIGVQQETDVIVFNKCPLCFWCKWK